MLENLEIGEAQAVEPEKLARTKRELPSPLMQAWDNTPVGEARRITVRSVAGADAEKVASLLPRLVRLYAKSQGLVAFKASAKVNDNLDIELYWQKKPARKTEPAILPVPAESAKPKGRRVAPTTDELRDE